MKRIPDPLVSSKARADRLHYATGELLGADDFRDEQTYHRRQLARALLHLQGSGTIAGLRVEHVHRPRSDGTDEVELQVQPGLALDHAGRLVEVPRPACLRLRAWYEFIAARAPLARELDARDLRVAWRAGAGGPPAGAVVADVFLSFHPCPRGYTPAFASGPFDALDASQPSRVRDAYELSLVPRTEAGDNPPEPGDPWAAIAGGTPAARLASAERMSLDMWRQVSETAPENPAGVDPTAVLLARLRLPAQENPQVDEAPTPDWSAATWTPAERHLDNTVRRVLLPPAALLRVLAP
jgi:hypothetical protein